MKSILSSGSFLKADSALTGQAWQVVRTQASNSGRWRPVFPMSNDTAQAHGRRYTCLAQERNIRQPLEPGGSDIMEESAQAFRGHMQRAISLLNLHIQYQENASDSDFLKKLRMRMELLAEALPLAARASEPGTTMAETFAAAEAIIARIYDPDGRNTCIYAL